ncbi:MAG: sel1 repeat family protein, partial [Proteobacteria bacterium]|nr:sel1 repeat family protein [Pseudomonadota bacterium]
MQQISDDQLARLEQAAGEGDVSIQYLLGQMFENGLGIPQNLDKAAKFYQKAADADYVLAQIDLGWMYAEGRGVEKNDALAASLWNQAAAQNDTRALTTVRGTQSPISASDLRDFVTGSMLNSIKDDVAEWAFRNLKIAITLISVAGVLGIGYTLIEAR